MKKRMLFILVVLVSFTPAVFADGNIGPFNQSVAADTAGASACSAGMHDPKADTNSGSAADGAGSQTKSGVAH